MVGNGDAAAAGSLLRASRIAPNNGASKGVPQESLQREMATVGASPHGEDRTRRASGWGQGGGTRDASKAGWLRVDDTRWAFACRLH